MAPVASYFTSFALVLNFLLASHAFATPLSMPMHRRQSSNSQLGVTRTAYEEVARIQNRLSLHAANKARNKQNAQTRSITTTRRSESLAPIEKRASGSGKGTETLTDFYSQFLDLQYYINVTVGTPAQTFQVVIDTGSSDFWIGAPGSLGLAATFDPTTSSTFEDADVPVSVTYGDGSGFSGTAGTDVVTMAGLTMQGTIVESGVQTDENFANRSLSGLIGLAWGSISSTGSNTFIEQLVVAKQVEQNLFSLYLSRGTDAINPGLGDTNGTVGGGSLTIGGIDNSTISGDVTFYPIVEEAHWVTQADAMVVNGQVIPGTEQLEAMMDSGTTLVAMPDNIFSALVKGLNATVDKSQGLPVVDCTKTIPEIALRISGTDYAIAAEDLASLVIPVNSSDLVQATGVKQGNIACYLPFAGGQTVGEDDENKPVTIFGDAFLKSWVSVYDVANKQIGLVASSPASKFNSASDVVQFKLNQEQLNANGSSSASSGSSGSGGSSGSTHKNSAVTQFAGGWAGMAVAMVACVASGI